MDGPGRPRLVSLGDFQFGAVTTETIEDALLHLAQQNEQAVQGALGRLGSFRETRIVEFVFLLSEQWCLEKSVSYQAVEILERFMVKQAESICRQGTLQLRENEKTEPHSWRTLKQQLLNKFILRLVSCVQLASKLSFHYRVISNVTVLNFLQALGYQYTKEELLESELDVLKSLNFQINLPTPLAYVEILLEVLGYNGCLVPATQLHATCLTLLDLVYLLHEPIYDSLLRASIENSTPSQLQGEKFISVKEDFMLLAVGIIAASAFVQNSECWSQVCSTDKASVGRIHLTDSVPPKVTEEILQKLSIQNHDEDEKVVGHLQSITGITLESIAEFSYAILTHSVGASTPARQQPAPRHVVVKALKAAAPLTREPELAEAASVNSLPSLQPPLPLSTLTFVTRGAKAPSIF